MTPNDVLRARARAQLKNNLFSNVWLYAIAVTFIYSIIISMASSVFVIGAFIAEGVFMYGVCMIFIQLVRGQKQNVDIGDLFKGAEHHLSDLVMLGLIKNVFIMLWSLLFIIPGIVKSYSYSMAYYIKLDHPEYDWKRCLDESQRIMNGYKWKLFCLDFSFIGWILLGSLVCGIGTLWVVPYQYAARANFYQDMCDTMRVNNPECYGQGAPQGDHQPQQQYYPPQNFQ
jgi:uncharacterized membrane protein